jgi:hypothetical protein
LSLIGLGRLGTFGVLDPAWLALIAGGLLIGTGVHWLRTPLHGLDWGSGQDGQVSEVSPGQASGWAGYSSSQQISKEVQQVMSRLRDPRNPEKTWAYLLMDSLKYRDDGSLCGYTIKAVKSGYFTNKRNRTETSNKLTKVMYGDWFTTFDEVEDTCSVFQKLPIPDVVPPPPLRLVRTVEEAISSYQEAYWEFGVDAHRNRIRAKMKDVPHVALISETGGGKSVMASSILEQLRPTFGCLLFDGKQADYPLQLGKLPNVIALSKSPAEHVIYARWAWEEMQERYIVSDRRKANGVSGTAAFDFPPLFVLIDETPSLRENLKNSYPDDKGETFDFYIKDLLQKGRQARIHLCLISQSLRVDSIPGSWQDNIKQMISLGRATDRTVTSPVIPEEHRGTVKAMSSTFSESAKGRGVYIKNENGVVSPIEFQGYYGWSEGTTVLSQAPTPAVRESWERAIDDTESIVSLYDRVGIKVDGPEWRELPMEELIKIPTVVVTDENGPIKEMAKYDPLSPEFLGNSKLIIGARARGRGSATQGS